MVDRIDKIDKTDKTDRVDRIDKAIKGDGATLDSDDFGEAPEAAPGSDGGPPTSQDDERAAS